MIYFLFKRRKPDLANKAFSDLPLILLHRSQSISNVTPPWRIYKHTNFSVIFFILESHCLLFHWRVPSFLHLQYSISIIYLQSALWQNFNTAFCENGRNSNSRQKSLYFSRKICYNIDRKPYCVSLWASPCHRFAALLYWRLRKNALASKHFCFMV